MDTFRPLDIDSDMSDAVENIDQLPINYPSGYKDLQIGEVRAIDLVLSSPDLKWEDALMQVGYNQDAAQKLSTTIYKKQAFKDYKQDKIDSITGGAEIAIVKDMADKCLMDTEELFEWGEKSPVSTQFKMRQYFLENYGGLKGKEEGSEVKNIFTLIQNNIGVDFGDV